MSTKKYSHQELVEIAGKWLSRKYPVVLTELVASGLEVPDAFAWRSSYSVLIECKVSTADFLADKNKFTRRAPDNEYTLGVNRYYLVPFKMKNYVLERAPERWGILIVNEKGRVRKVRESGLFTTNRNREIDLLLSVIRRIAGNKRPLDGVGIRCYSSDLAPDDPRASLYVAPIIDFG